MNHDDQELANDAEFLSELELVRPLPPGDSSALFYQMGWNAALKSQMETDTFRSQGLSTFGRGISAGTICGIAATLALIFGLNPILYGPSQSDTDLHESQFAHQQTSAQAPTHLSSPDRDTNNQSDRSQSDRLFAVGNATAMATSQVVNWLLPPKSLPPAKNRLSDDGQTNFIRWKGPFYPNDSLPTDSDRKTTRTPTALSIKDSRNWETF